MHRRHHARSARAYVKAARARAAFGDRLVVHRRVGAGRHQQQLGRLARASRAGLHGDGAVRRRRCDRHLAARESSWHPTGRIPARRADAHRKRHVRRRRCPRRRSRVRPRIRDPCARCRCFDARTLQRRPATAVRGFRFRRQGHDVRRASRHVRCGEGRKGLLYRHERDDSAHRHPPPRARELRVSADCGRIHASQCIRCGEEVRQGYFRHHRSVRHRTAAYVLQLEDASCCRIICQPVSTSIGTAPSII